MYTTYLKTFAIGVSIIAFVLSIVFLAFAQTGYITSAVQDELDFRELSQPRISFIENETHSCISFEVRDTPELNQAWQELSGNTGFFDFDLPNKDWIQYALLGEDFFPRPVSSVHNTDYYNLKQLVSTMCPYDKSMKNEYRYWYHRVYNTPINEWFDYYNPIVIN